MVIKSSSFLFPSDILKLFILSLSFLASSYSLMFSVINFTLVQIATFHCWKSQKRFCALRKKYSAKFSKNFNSGNQCSSFFAVFCWAFRLSALLSLYSWKFLLKIYRQVQISKRNFNPSPQPLCLFPLVGENKVFTRWIFLKNFRNSSFFSRNWTKISDINCIKWF